MKLRLVLHLLMLVIALSPTFEATATALYRIDPQHTFSTFEYEHWGLSLQHGRFDSNTGTIAFDTATGDGAIDIEIAAASVSTGSSVFDTILRSADFFNAAAYPKITFKSTRLIFAGERLMQVDGILTIKAISRSITLDMTHFNCRFMPAYGKRACGANGSARLSRSDFELGKYVPFVSDIVTLRVSVEAIKED